MISLIRNARREVDEFKSRPARVGHGRILSLATLYSKAEETSMSFRKIRESDCSSIRSRQNHESQNASYRIVSMILSVPCVSLKMMSCSDWFSTRSQWGRAKKLLMCKLFLTGFLRRLRHLFSIQSNVLWPMAKAASSVKARAS